MKKLICASICLSLVMSFNAFAYSSNWKEDGAGNWKYYENGTTVVTNAWVHDDNEWYLLGEDGIMRTGIFQSNENKYYLLDAVRGTGTYGKLLKDGMNYNGIVLHCDTSEAYEGALSDETIAALKNKGLFDSNSIPYVGNTRHVEVGDEGASGGNNANQSANFQSQIETQVDISKMTDDELYDYLGFDRPSTSNPYSSNDDSNTGRVVGQ